MILTMISREIRMLLQASLLIRSGKLPKFSANMEYGTFQKNIYPVVAGLASDGSRKEDLLVSKHPL